MLDGAAIIPRSCNVLYSFFSGLGRGGDGCLGVTGCGRVPILSQVNLEKRQSALAAVIVEKQPEAQRRVKGILDEHKRDMELLQGKYEHASV